MRKLHLAFTLPEKFNLLAGSELFEKFFFFNRQIAFVSTWLLIVGNRLLI